MGKGVGWGGKTADREREGGRERERERGGRERERERLPICRLTAKVQTAFIDSLVQDQLPETSYNNTMYHENGCGLVL